MVFQWLCKICNRLVQAFQCYNIKKNSMQQWCPCPDRHTCPNDKKSSLIPLSSISTGKSHERAETTSQPEEDGFSDMSDWLVEVTRTRVQSA